MPMTFLEKSFPPGISFGASGGPERRTRVLTFGNGGEVRASNWAGSRRRYDAGTGIRSLGDLFLVLELFEEARGRLHGFRFKDPFDHSTAMSTGSPSALDVVLGQGDGATATFQLAKTYGNGAAAYSRKITKPVAQTLAVAVDGVPLVVGDGLGSAVSLDATTGLITFSAEAIPQGGSTITAGFVFDTPVRFDSDQLEASLTHFQAGQVPSIPLVELLL
ncbi:DUF2460 domain-containing protein [Pseudovibrio sp. SPO723]|uniref:DUF2460 domain-containing protein n=1 Tax=Nesiotobacter zosterae TaxID=392721 RepID=UPI0029C1432A|nr:DUF2460 domain-containing protein [Pseudovibrio sp. SPO723]MDX5595582.1 DUF2460 domain-containing protein [Pseudovibrio sp. SPO723]